MPDDAFLWTRLNMLGGSRLRSISGYNLWLSFLLLHVFSPCLLGLPQASLLALPYSPSVCLSIGTLASSFHNFSFCLSSLLLCPSPHFLLFISLFSLPIYFLNTVKILFSSFYFLFAFLPLLLVSTLQLLSPHFTFAFVCPLNILVPSLSVLFHCHAFPHQYLPSSFFHPLRGYYIIVFLPSNHVLCHVSKPTFHAVF